MPDNTQMPVRGVAVPSERTGVLFTSGTNVFRQSGGGAAVAIGSGWTAPAGLAVDEDLLVLDGVTLYRVPLDTPDRTAAVEVATLPGTPGQLTSAGGSAYVTDRDGGQLLSVDLTTGTVTAIVTGLTDPHGVLLTADLAGAWVTETATGRIVLVNIAFGSATEYRTGLAAPAQLSGDGSTLVTTYGDGSVEWWNPATGSTTTMATVSPDVHPLVAWVSGVDIAVAGDDGIRFTPAAWRPATISLPETRPVLGSYHRVVIDPGDMGVAPADIDLDLPDGDPAGRVSYSADDTSAPGELVLLVGSDLGRHVLRAVDRTNGIEIATTAFTSVDVWPDHDAGPPIWVQGTVRIGSTHSGSTHSGPAPTAPGPDPRNVNIWPANGDRRVAVVAVEFKDAVYPASPGFDTLMKPFTDALVGPDSAHTYYHEVSFGAFGISLASTTVPRITLPDKFSAYLTKQDDGTYLPTDDHSFGQAVVSAAAKLEDASGAPLFDLVHDVQSLILVVKSKSSTHYYWPYAFEGTPQLSGASAELRFFGVPDNWAAVGDDPDIGAVVSHEMGHNLGLPDLYTNADPTYSADVIKRDIGDYDLMSNESDRPFLTVAQRLELGWVKPEWVRSFDFGGSTAAVDAPVTLYAAELGSPPPNTVSAVEIHIASGVNLYFEYRSTQPGNADQQIGTESDTGDLVVLGTDVLSDQQAAPIGRPQIIRVEPNSDGLTFFANGQVWSQAEDSSGFQLSVEVINTHTTTSDIRVKYGTNGRPDLSIRPWPGGKVWQSPDIFVTNAKSDNDPAHWANVPWVGHANTITARYTNHGPVTMTNVGVSFFVKDFSVTNAPETLIETVYHDVPPDTTMPVVEFSTQWIPVTGHHQCIVVRSPLYLDTSVTPNVVEWSDANNIAQSNYTRFNSAAASPAHRQMLSVTVENPYHVPASISVLPQISGRYADLYRVYLEHASVRLNPGESRAVGVMVESLWGDPHTAPQWAPIEDRIFDEDAVVTLRGFGQRPYGHPQLLGGAQINVASARATLFTAFRYLASDHVVDGQVQTAGGDPVPGEVLITFHGPDETSANTIVVPLAPDGGFELLRVNTYIQRFRATRISAHYPGGRGYADCDAPSEPPA